MTALILNNIANLQDTTTSQNTINGNSASTVTAVGLCLAKDGSDSQLTGNIDANSNRILNLPSPSSLDEPLRLVDLNSFVNGNLSISLASLSGVRTAHTSNYSLSPSDNGKTIALGGNTLFTFTAGAASGFTSPFSVKVVNEDSGRAKFIVINGYTQFTLWPNQEFVLENQNNIWQFNAPGKWIVPGSATLFVDHAHGSDTLGDGLATGSGALATISNAWVVALTQISIGVNGTMTIQNAQETFTESPVFVGEGPGGGTNSGVTFIVGNDNNPDSCIWNTNGIVIKDGAKPSFRGFKLVAAASSIPVVTVGKLGIFFYNNMDFGTATSGQHINIIESGKAIFEGGSGGGTYTISGNMSSHIINNGGVWECGGATINLPNALTFGAFYIGVGPGSYTNLGANIFTGTGSGAGSTGQQYTVDSGAYLKLGGVNTFPGNQAGAKTNGAIVDGIMAIPSFTAALGSDVTLPIGTFTEGPFITQPNSGTWLVMGQVAVTDTAGAATFFVNLQDGTTIIASGYFATTGANAFGIVSLSGIITNPAGNLRFLVKDVTSGNGKISASGAGASSSVISAIRIG